jgi:hypothetical protein
VRYEINKIENKKEGSFFAFSWQIPGLLLPILNSKDELKADKGDPLELQRFFVLPNCLTHWLQK